MEPGRTVRSRASTSEIVCVFSSTHQMASPDSGRPLSKFPAEPVLDLFSTIQYSLGWLLSYSTSAAAVVSELGNVKQWRCLSLRCEGLRSIWGRIQPIFI